MRRTYRNALAALPLALALATATMAGQGPAQDGHGQRGAHRMERLKTKLGLTDDQLKSIRAAKEANREQRRQLHEQMRQATADARQAALNGEDVRSKNAAAAKLYAQMLDLRAEELKRIGKLLTPDQRTAFASMKGRGHGGHWKHRGQKSPEDASAED